MRLTSVGADAVRAHDAQDDSPAGDRLRLYSLLADWLGRDAPILDVGCGSGNKLIPLTEQCEATVYGVDIDQDMVAALLGRAPQLKRRVVFGSADALPFRAHVFGGVIAAHLWHLLDDDQPVINEMARVLIPGGRVAVNFGAASDRRDGLEVGAAIRQRFALAAGIEAAMGPPATPSLDELIAPVVERFARTGLQRQADIVVESTIPRPLEWHITRLAANPYVWPAGTDMSKLEAAAPEVRSWAVDRFGPLDAPHPTQRVNRYVCWEREDTR